MERIQMGCDEGGKEEVSEAAESTGDSECDVAAKGSAAALLAIEEDGYESCNCCGTNGDDDGSCVEEGDEVGNCQEEATKVNKRNNDTNKKKMKKKKKREVVVVMVERIRRQEDGRSVDEKEEDRLFWETCLASGYP